MKKKYFSIKDNSYLASLWLKTEFKATPFLEKFRINFRKISK